MSVKKVLQVSGVLTVIAVAIPQSVGYGLILLLVPGFILMLAPTVFIYTATFAIVRRYLPITHAVALDLLAGFITLGLGVLVPLPMAAASWLAVSWATSGDVVPHDRVVIGGDVLLNSYETPTEYIAGRRQVPCDALCAALLDTPGVRTVTIAHADSRTSYRLMPKGEAGFNARAAKTPEQIVQYLPKTPANERDYQADMAVRKAQENEITARWALRLANDVTLATVPSPQHHDLTIAVTFTGPNGFHHVAVKQVEVRDREGRVLLRRQHATAKRVFVPLLLLPGDPFNATWRLAEWDFESSGGFGNRNAATVLFEETTLARPAEPGAAAASVVAGMRDRLAAALMQPGAPADLSLANPWLGTIDWRSINDDDIELVGKLIADARVRDPRLYEGSFGFTRAEHRGAIVSRLLDPTTLPQLRSRLNTLVRNMPPGTFAVSTPDELALLHNPLLRMNAPGLVRRLADQGKAGVPELVRILQEDVRVEPSAARQDVLTAVRRALIRLGPDATIALPVVIELFDQEHTPLANDGSEMDEWRVAMVRMGRPVEDVPFEPRLTAEQIARRRSDLMQSVRRAPHNPDWSL